MIEDNRRAYLLARVRAQTVIHPNGCHIWQGQVNNGGYGLISFATHKGDGFNSPKTVHRAVYMAFHNVILTSHKQVICHTCDNPPCVNPAHLFLESHLDNALDKIEKNHHAKKYTYHNRERVFTSEQIEAIRKDEGLLKDVAHRHKVSVSYVSKLRRGLQKR
jgi:hypothetical protein